MPIRSNSVSTRTRSSLEDIDSLEHRQLPGILLDPNVRLDVVDVRYH